MTDWLEEYRDHSYLEEDWGEDISMHFDYRGELTLPREFFDVVAVVVMGETKYPGANWLNEGTTFQGKENEDHMFHHLAALQTAKTAEDYLDTESGLDHGLHLACRALMGYVRRTRGLE